MVSERRTQGKDAKRETAEVACTRNSTRSLTLVSFADDAGGGPVAVVGVLGGRGRRRRAHVPHHAERGLLRLRRRDAASHDEHGEQIS